MADLIRRQERDIEPLRLLREDPFRLMREWLEGAPVLGRGFVPAAGVFNPDFELKETKDSYIVRADVPGVKEDDIDISVTGNRVTISGKRESERKEEGEQFHLYERSFGSFSRAFTMPDDVDMDRIDAKCESGVLTLAVPKKAESQPKKISLKGLKEKAGKAKA